MSARGTTNITRFNICYQERPCAADAPPASPPMDDIRLLYQDESYRDYLLEIGADPALIPDVDSLSTLDGAPSVTVPFFNDYTNVLTLPAPDKATLYRILRRSSRSEMSIEQTVRYAVPKHGVDRDCFSDIGDGELVPEGVNKIEAPAVWDNGVTGAGVAIAVVDTGYIRHPDLPSPTRVQSFVPGHSSVVDENGHGTYVTGIALARRNWRQLIGVAPEATLIVARAGDADGKSEDSWIAAAIIWSALQGAAVINVCVVAREPSEVMRRAVDCASRTSIICAAAGNGGRAALDYPAAYPAAISVGATQIADVVCKASNWADEMTIAAPGCPILSTSMDGGTVCDSGSSAATPHVSGVIALMRQKHPHWTLKEIREQMQHTGVEVMGGGLVRRVDASECVR